MLGDFVVLDGLHEGFGVGGAEGEGVDGGALGGEGEVGIGGENGGGGFGVVGAG